MRKTLQHLRLEPEMVLQLPPYRGGRTDIVAVHGSGLTTQFERGKQVAQRQAGTNAYAARAILLRSFDRTVAGAALLSSRA